MSTSFAAHRAVPLLSACTIVRVFMPPEAESHERFSSSWDYVLLLLKSSTLKIYTSHDSTNDSSHHVNVAQYSMWLLDARGCVGLISSARFGLAPCFRMQQEQRLHVKRDAKAPPCCTIAFRLCHIIDFLKFCTRGMSCAVSFMVVEDAATRSQSREVCFFRKVSYACCTSHLSVYHGPRIDPRITGPAQATQLSEILRVPVEQSMFEVRENEDSVRGLDARTRFCKD